MGRYYHCYHVEKRVSKWGENGADTESRIVIFDKCDLTAIDLPSLLKRIANEHGYEGNYWFICEPNDDGGIDGVSFNQIEDDRGCVVNDESEHDDQCWIADYLFSIEVIVDSDVSVSDFEAIANDFQFDGLPSKA